MRRERPDVRLVPLADDDRNQFVLDNQRAFNYGALEEFGVRDDHLEEDGQIISRETIEHALDEGQAYRIVADGEVSGGLVVRVRKDHGDLDLLFVDPKAHGQGIGQAAWAAVEARYPEVGVWGLDTPYFEKRNVHFYVNRLGFRITEFYNARYPEPMGGDEAEAHADGSGDVGADESFRFRKVMAAYTHGNAPSSASVPLGHSPRRGHLPAVSLEGPDRRAFGHDNLVAIHAADAERAVARGVAIAGLDPGARDEEAEAAIDGGDAYRIVWDGRAVGGVIVTVDGSKGGLTLLFVSPSERGRGIGQATWALVERRYPEVELWETITPYHDKRNVHFYVNRLGFEAVEFYNDHHRDRGDGDDGGEGEWLRFEKGMARRDLP